MVFLINSFIIKEKLYPFEIWLQSSKSASCPTHYTANPSEVDK